MLYRLAEGLSTLGISGRYPWQPCEREPPLHAAANWHRHTERNSVENTHLGPILTDTAKTQEGAWVGWEQESAKIRFKAKATSGLEKNLNSSLPFGYPFFDLVGRQLAWVGK